MIKTESLTRVFRTDEIETTALKGLDIQIEEGEFVSIMGESGCGKSTLLHLLGMLDSPTSGKYFFDGADISSMNESKRAEYRKKNLGFIFQNFNLIDELTVFENVELPLVYLNKPKSERKALVLNMLKEVGIEHRAKHFPQQLSGGQQQRVAVARAIIAGPKLILADEPTGNLDSANGDDVMNLLSDLNKQGTTVVMVTHSQHDASFGNRILRLKDGQLD